MGWWDEIGKQELSGIFDFVRDAAASVGGNVSSGNAPGELNSPIRNTGSSSEVQNQERDRVLGQMGAVLDFTAPQPFNDRLMVFAGISSDFNKRDEDRRKMFVFEINPARLQRQKRKNQSAIFLGKSEADAVNKQVSPAEFHFLNLQFETFSYSGVTPAFNPLRYGGYGNSQMAKLPGAWDTKFGDYATSPGWLWFLSFQDFYDEYGDKFMLMKYLNHFYQGVLDELSFTRDANAPFNIRYTFTFRAVYAYDLSVGMGFTRSGYEPDAGPQSGSGDLVQKLVVKSSAPPLNLKSRGESSAPQMYLDDTAAITSGDVVFVNYVEEQNIGPGPSSQTHDEREAQKAAVGGGAVAVGGRLRG